MTDDTQPWTPDDTDRGEATDHRSIRLADDLDLAPSITGGRIAVLGRTGSGKSCTTRVLVEEAIRLGQTVVVIDPMGHWRGIRVAREGGPGLPVIVAADDPGADIDLDDPHAIAQAAIRGANVVADLSSLRGALLVRIAASILDELYQSAGAHPILVVVEEADELAPQQPSRPGQRDSLEAVERIARRGRGRGIGLVVITQRSAAIAKGVISQLDLMVAFASPAPQDRKAIALWIPAGDDPRERQLLAGIGAMPVGEALVWRPSSNQLTRHRMRLPWTSDQTAPAARLLAASEVGSVGEAGGGGEDQDDVELVDEVAAADEVVVGRAPVDRSAPATGGIPASAAPVHLAAKQLAELAELVAQKVVAALAPADTTAEPVDAAVPVVEDVPAAATEVPAGPEDPPKRILALLRVTLDLDLDALFVELADLDASTVLDAVADLARAGTVRIEDRRLRLATASRVVRSF